MVKESTPVVEILVRNLVCHVEMNRSEEFLRSKFAPYTQIVSEVSNQL